MLGAGVLWVSGLGWAWGFKNRTNQDITNSFLGGLGLNSQKSSWLKFASLKPLTLQYLWLHNPKTLNPAVSVAAQGEH